MQYEHSDDYQRTWLLFIVATAVLALVVIKTCQEVGTGLLVLIQLETLVVVFCYAIETHKSTKRHIKLQEQEAYSDIYTTQMQITSHFLDSSSELRAMFYGGAEESVSEDVYRKALYLAEMIADFFEHLYLDMEAGAIPESAKSGWEQYMKAKCQQAAVLRRYFRDNQSFYSPGLLALLGGAS